jgi:peptidyl-prolyl cis-trans isomerase B (cyclophilin B)
MGYTVIIRLTTNRGVIDIELNETAAPKTCANFVKYVRDGFYNGTIFHRVIRGFMIQGGGMEPGLVQKQTRAPIENEATNGLKNKKYTVAMARTNEPHSATSQFFINVADNAFLNHTAPSGQGWGYAVFGEVVEGKDVVDAISTVPTGNRNFYGDVPVDDIVIEKAEVLPAAA